MKRAMFLAGGVLWLCFALGFAAFLAQYIAGGAGWQFFGGLVSSASLLMGLVHLVGLGTAMLICFAIGAGLCARGMTGENNEDDGRNANEPQQREASLPSNKL